LQTREIIESKKEVVAADFQSEGAYFVQREHDETSSQVQILRADVLQVLCLFKCHLL
jgi:hypothetical protein